MKHLERAAEDLGVAPLAGLARWARFKVAARGNLAPDPGAPPQLALDGEPVTLGDIELFLQAAQQELETLE